MTRFPRLLLASALLIGLGLPAAAQTEAAATEAAPAPAASLPAITVTAVTKAMLRDRVMSSGLIGPVEQVQVQPLIEGQPIETLLADVGDFVTAGQVLATLSSSTLELQKVQLLASRASAAATVAQTEAQLAEAQASADEAQRVNTRTAALRKQGTSSQAAADTASANAITASARVSAGRQTLAAAKAQVTLADAQIANIDLQLSRTKVVAPVAGEIVERNAQVGGIASAAGHAMFVLIRDGALELRADLSERDVARVVPGQTVRLTSVGSSDVLTGTVRMVEPQIDATTRLGRARITIDTPEKLRSGMFADAEILVVERDSVVVPVTAVGASGGETTVMRVQDNVVTRTPVTTGIRDAGFVEILTGLAPGDLVVKKAAAFVRDGDKINPMPDAPAGTN